MAPTRSSFLASWRSVGDATGYRIDVSTDPSFKSYVSGYEHCDVGNVTSRIVSRLNPGTKYYYRVQPYNSAGAGPNSEIAAATTTTASGLVINPTFDSSITGNPQSAAIQSMINQAIALYQPLFGDPVTVEILFRYSDTEPDGTPIDGPIAESLYVVYGIPWGAYIFNLKADAKTTNDTTANAGLPTLPMTPNLVTASANGRAIGLDTPPAMFADGTVADGGPYDGIVTTQFQRTTPIYPPAQQRQLRCTTAYGARNRRDPRLGIIPRRPSVEFRLSSAGSVQLVELPARGTIPSSAHATFRSIMETTNIVGFNQDPTGDFGDWLSGSCPQSTPYVQNAFACKGQASDITATSPEGVNLDVIGYDLTSAIPPPGPTILGNISTRTLVETGDKVLIGGFIVAGTQPKKVIVRAIGPSLPLTGCVAKSFPRAA